MAPASYKMNHWVSIQMAQKLGNLCNWKVHGGMIYSSVVPVTVTEKQMITADPNNSHEASTEDTKPSGQPASQTETTNAETTNAETTGSDEMPDTNTTETPDVQQSNESFPWWVIVLLCVVTAGIGFGVAVVVIKKKP